MRGKQPSARIWVCTQVREACKAISPRSGPRELVGHGRLWFYRDGPAPVSHGGRRAYCQGRRQPLCRDARGPGCRLGLRRSIVRRARPYGLQRAGRVGRRRHNGRRPRASRRQGSRRHRSFRGEYGGDALRRGPSGRLHEQRRRHAQLPRGGQARRRRTLYLRLERRDHRWRGRAAHPRRDAPASRRTLRGEQAGGRGFFSAYFNTFGVETVALLFGNVYVPLSGHKNSVVARFIKRAVEGESLEIYGDGTQTRDFIFVDDLIRAVRLSATVEDVGGEVFQIATSAETMVQELTDSLLPILAAEGIENVEVRKTTARRGEVRRNYADTSKAQRMLGWKAEVGLDEGLGRTVEWFLGR